MLVRCISVSFREVRRAVRSGIRRGPCADRRVRLGRGQVSLSVLFLLINCLYLSCLMKNYSDFIKYLPSDY